MRRVARGVDKFVVKSANPFLVVVNHAGEFRGQRLGTAPDHYSKTWVWGGKPAMVPWTVTNTTNSTGHPVNEPIDTARTGGGGGQMFLGASLIQYHTEQSEHVRGQEITGPIMTIDAANRYGLTAGQPGQILRERAPRPSIQDPLPHGHSKRPGGADNRPPGQNERHQPGRTGHGAGADYHRPAEAIMVWSPRKSPERSRGRISDTGPEIPGAAEYILRL